MLKFVLAGVICALLGESLPGPGFLGLCYCPSTWTTLPSMDASLEYPLRCHLDQFGYLVAAIQPGLKHVSMIRVVALPLAHHFAGHLSEEYHKVSLWQAGLNGRDRRTCNRLKRVLTLPCSSGSKQFGRAILSRGFPAVHRGRQSPSSESLKQGRASSRFFYCFEYLGGHVVHVYFCARSVANVASFST